MCQKLTIQFPFMFQTADNFARQNYVNALMNSWKSIDTFSNHSAAVSQKFHTEVFFYF